MVMPVGSGTADTTVANLARFGWLKLDDDPAHGPGEISVVSGHAEPLLPFEAVCTDGEAYCSSSLINPRVRPEYNSKNNSERQCLCRR